MKKITSTISLLFLGCAIFAQTGVVKTKLMTPRVIGGKTALAKTANNKQAITNVSTQAAFFTDDFSVPSHWTMASPTSGGGPFSLWKIDTIGPNGMGSAAPYNIPKIKSTTASNGFATFDSNNDCSGNQVADITTATPINCSAHPFINLTFQEDYRRWYDSTFVYVSKDNVTYTKYVVNHAMAVKDITPNPTTVKVDISAVAGGQATVWIRFEFASLGAWTTNSPGCGYAYMIDDVALTDMPANDLSLDHAYADFGAQDLGYYTQTPITQIVPMTFRAAIANNGFAAQTVNNLNVKISNGTSTVYNQTGSAIATLAYGKRDTIYDTLTAFTPASSVANYTARFLVSQTQTENPADTANNAVVKKFSVSDTVFARDNGIAHKGVTGPDNYTGGDVDGSAIGNLFLMNGGGTIASISAYVDTITALGTSIQYKIMRVDSAGGFTEIGTTGIYNVSNKALLGKWMTMALPAPLSVLPGTYIASVVATGQTPGSTTAAPLGVFLGADKTTQQPLHTSYVYTAGSSPAAWGYITELPMIRMNIVKGPAGIKENINELTLVSAFPNPATRTISINYSVSTVSNVLIEIYDIAGKKMDSFKETSVNGTRVSKVDLSNYAAGTYFYSVTSDHSKLDGKFVVTNK
jgi:hypothetical protein